VIHAAVTSAGSIAQNVADVRARILRACDRARRAPCDVTLVGVTKTVPAALIREALDAGISHVGENRIQDAIEKMKEVADRAPIWHFIGHLQTNKARLAAETFDCIESVDSLKLARVLEEDALEIGRELNVYVQVNVGGEESKGGVAPEDLVQLVEEIDAMPSILVTGLMAIPPARTDPDDSRRDFRELKGIYDRIRERHPEIVHLSMGMSSDFEIAIEEGATEVRVGTALFGAR
jgi:pyridoxal phosphate enzyme (YggS family)